MATVDKKLIAALVSVNYSDFLELVLPFNTKIFDTIYVITTKEDEECIDICSKYDNVDCFIVGDTVLKKNNASFNRGAAYNLLFDKLSLEEYDEWICLTDSDIIFPPNLRELVSKVDYGPMYSLPRSFCQNENQFKRYISAVGSGKPHSLSVDRRSPKDVLVLATCSYFNLKNKSECLKILMMLAKSTMSLEINISGKIASFSTMLNIASILVLHTQTGAKEKVKNGKFNLTS